MGGYAISNISDYLQTIGQFPVVSLQAFVRSQQLQGTLLACLAYGGATGTIKSPLAYGMLALAQEGKLLQPRQTVVEASCGTFGVALALACRQLGHPLILCVPFTTDHARVELLKQLGASVHLCEANCQQQLSQIAKEYAQTHNAYYMDCFSNDLNPEFHRRVTGPAIFRATGGDLDFIVIGVGTGGTITGVGEYAKAWSNASIIAVEPYESQCLNEGFAGSHSIEGIGLGFVPDNYNPYVVNRIIAVSSGEAATTAHQILLTQGIPACRSAGAVAEAACHLLREKPSSRVLCVFSGIELCR